MLPGPPVLDAEALRRSGSSPAAIAAHYDLPADFFATWLGPDLVYSCARWDDDDPAQTVARAQQAKIDYFARELDVGGRRLLDVGCGWGAAVRRFAGEHGAAAAVGLTLSGSQRSYALDHPRPGVDVRLESWIDHVPTAPYDAITCIEATEHLAHDGLTSDEKVAVYAAFVERLASWLVPDGRLGLQLICLDDVSHAGSRPGRGPLSELIRTGIFPEAMSASLGELALAWEPHFRLERFEARPDHYVRTFRAWNLALRADRERAAALVDGPTLRLVERYLAAGEALFRLGEQTLYRVVLRRRPTPKVWRTPLRPGLLRAGGAEGAARPAPAASAAAVQAHYDLSNDFFALWLDPSMAYSSGLWQGEDDDLEQATARKARFFLDALDLPAHGRLLDVGCGWGAALALALREHPGLDAVGLTLSPAQKERCRAAPRPSRRGTARAVAGARALRPLRRHPQLRRLRALRPGRLAARSSASSPTAASSPPAMPGSRPAAGSRSRRSRTTTPPTPPRSRAGGRSATPSSTCSPSPCARTWPRSSWGSNPGSGWRSCAATPPTSPAPSGPGRSGCGRTRSGGASWWGPTLVRAFRRYLASSEVQFRTGTLTNYRLVLRRRDIPHEPWHRTGTDRGRRDRRSLACARGHQHGVVRSRP